MHSQNPQAPLDRDRHKCLLYIHLVRLRGLLDINRLTAQRNKKKEQRETQFGESTENFILKVESLFYKSEIHTKMSTKGY